MRLPPVISATVSFKSTRGGAGKAGEAGRAGGAGGKGGWGCRPAPPAPPAPPALVRERPEKRGPLVRVAPLRTERGTGERVRGGDADGRGGGRGEGSGQQLGAAGR